MTQEDALTILKTGANVFLTGEPGAGKTYTVNSYVAWLRERGIEPAITASTGIAATHIGGMTIHAWSGIGIRGSMSEYELEALLEREPLVRRVRNCNVLIIDEISMLHAQLLTLVDQAVRTIKQSVRPFGGMQVVFVGDFFQLPPISKDSVSTFAFNSESWDRANPLVCYISEQHRQEDDVFLQLLSALRAGEIDEAHIEILQARKQEPKGLSTRLYPHNENVDRINTEELGRIGAEGKTYQMQTSGAKALVEGLVRGCLSPETLVIKRGAAVMFTRNNFDAGYVNGTLGTVEKFSDGGYPVVRTREGALIEADPVEWRVEDGKRVLAKLVQVPLRLAWAITVHKSQGMSLDSAHMDLSQAFEYGQGYVALSRVRTLAGLYLAGFNRRALEVHPEILEKDRDFRSASDAAAAAFARMPAEERATLQNNFIKMSGGHEPKVGEKLEKKAEPGDRLAKMREKHPNAYRPWSKEDDARLTELFRESKKVSELVKEFGRQRGAIHSRLVRLGLVEPDDL
ncbi:MAG: PIF1 family DEAD/DEAH box helicase [Patescibacteria group bacterium]